jgi:hypothetical protein
MGSALSHGMLASEVRGEPVRCPSCGNPMHYYGGSAGFICCDYKVLFNDSGWFDRNGLHIKDDRLAGGTRRVDGVVRKV